MSLIDMITAVFGKPKYEDKGITVFSPEQKAEHTAMIDASEEYHWRDKDKCIACSKRRVVMKVPQYHDFGHHVTENVCAKCAKEMYGMSRYLFNETTKQHEYIELDTWAQNNYAQLKGE
tara:strand:- start:42 stop:398 length:357 start_codon:yes stop_codon:yes gene_type:complete